MQAGELVVERRGDRVMAALPGSRIAWFATTPASVVHLRTEDKVLTLVDARCTFRVPVVLASGSEGWTVRSTVPGAVDPDGFAAWLKAEPALLRGVVRTLAQALAKQHTRIAEADVTGWLPTAPAWPLPPGESETRFPFVVDDDLRRRISRLLAGGHDLDTRPEDRVLVHSDLGLHNVACGPATGAINGVFDCGRRDFSRPAPRLPPFRVPRRAGTHAAKRADMKAKVVALDRSASCYTTSLPLPAISSLASGTGRTRRSLAGDLA